MSRRRRKVIDPLLGNELTTPLADEIIAKMDARLYPPELSWDERRSRHHYVTKADVAAYLSRKSIPSFLVQLDHWPNPKRRLFDCPTELLLAFIERHFDEEAGEGRDFTITDHQLSFLLDGHHDGYLWFTDEG